MHQPDTSPVVSVPVASKASPRPQTAPDIKRISSAALLGQARLVEIAHDGQIYQLRLTAAGKLILTK